MTRRSGRAQRRIVPQEGQRLLRITRRGTGSVIRLRAIHPGFRAEDRERGAQQVPVVIQARASRKRWLMALAPAESMVVPSSR